MRIFFSSDFFDVILALWLSLNTDFAFIPLFSPFAVSLSSSHNSTDFFSHTTTFPYTVYFSPILTFPDAAAFLLLHADDSHFYSSAP